MNWDDLRLFLAVARGGSISGGARRLGMQHSTVSRRMRRLEAELGVRLFDKVPGGHELTGAGRGLMVCAENMERELLEADGLFGGAEARPSGLLRVTAVDNMACGILMPLFAAFSRAYPEITLQIMVSNEDVSLARREADVAIRLTNEPPETLVGKRVATVASAVYGGTDYLQAMRAQGRAPVWLGVDCCSFHRNWTREVSDGETAGFVVDDTLLTRAALREGLGIAILPCFMGDADAALERLGGFRPEWELGLWILFHPDLRRSARVLVFREYMGQAIAELEDVLAGHRPDEAGDGSPVRHRG